MGLVWTSSLAKCGEICYWNGAVSPTAFTFAGNWSPAQVPGSEDGAWFYGRTWNDPIDVPDDTSIFTMAVARGGMTLNLFGEMSIRGLVAGFTSSRGTATLLAPPSQTATVTTIETAVGAVFEIINSPTGFTEGASGTLNISAGVNLLTQQLRVGTYEGHGQLNIAAGGSVLSSSLATVGGDRQSTGGVKVSGAGATLEVTAPSGIVIATEGVAALEVNGGGLMRATQLYAATAPASLATLTLSGASSRIECLNANLGSQGRSDLTIRDGGVFATQNVFHLTTGDAKIIGSSGGGNAFLTAATFIAGGNANTNGRITLASGGELFASGSIELRAGGALDLRPGGRASVGGVSSIGGQVEWNGGTLLINGTAPIIISGSSLFGGPMQINNGSALSAFDAPVHIAGNLSLSGVAGAGGLLGKTLAVDSAGRLDIINAGAFGLSGVENHGTINLVGGKLQASAATARIDNYGQINLYGSTIVGALTMYGGAAVNSIDSVTFNSPVNGTGAFTGVGKVTFNAGYFPGYGLASTIPFAGPVALTEANQLSINLVPALNASDRLAIQGGVEIGGALRLTMPTGGGMPIYGQSFQLITATVRAGSFSSIAGVEFSPLMWWAVTYGATGVIATAALPGDANLDASVNFDDLLVLAQHYGHPSIQTWATGDFDGTGTVAFDDLLTLAQHYDANAVAENTRLAALGGAYFVSDWRLAQALAPEPSVCLALALAAWPTRRRR